MEDFRYILPGKLVIVGDNSTGKTCLLMREMSAQFPKDFLPNVYSQCHRVKKVNGQDIKLYLWDTSGGKEYIRLRPLAYPQTDVFCICFDVNSKPSFENVKSEWIKEVYHHCPEVPVLLVGCKIDLRTNDEKIKEMNEKNLQFITEEQGHEMAAEIGAAKYMECSALTGQGVDHVFQTLAELAMKKINGNKKTRRFCTLT